MSTRCSVIVPVLDGASHIGACLASILPELASDDELIVVDNGSTDATRSIVSAVRDPRLRLLDEARPGPSAARNRGLASATGRYIAFQDHDDLWPAGRQAALFAALSAAPSANAAHGRTSVIFDGPIDPRYAAMEGQFVHRHNLLTSLFERGLIDRAGPLDETLTLAEDVEYLVRLRAAGMVSATTDAIVQIRRRHDRNLTLREATPVGEQMLQVMRRNIVRNRAKG